MQLQSVLMCDTNVHVCVCSQPISPWPRPQWEGGRQAPPRPLPKLRVCCTLRCTRTQCTRRMTFLPFLFCSPASALRCPGPLHTTPSHARAPRAAMHLLHSIAWHGRTSSKNFHLIAAKNGKNKKEKEKETKRRRIKKKKRKKWKFAVGFCLQFFDCVGTNEGATRSGGQLSVTATTPTATAAAAATRAMRCVATWCVLRHCPKWFFNCLHTPCVALRCLALDGHMHRAQHPAPRSTCTPPPFISTGKHTPMQKRPQRRIAVEAQ